MWYNIPVSWLLRSPLHSILDKKFLLLTVSGRKSGKRYTLPVNYLRIENALWITSKLERRWWRNVRGGAPVTILYHGKVIQGYAGAMTDQVDVIQALKTYLEFAPGLARYYGVGLDADGKLKAEDLPGAANGLVMIRIELTE